MQHPSCIPLPSAATALALLLADHPDLATLTWTVKPSGTLQAEGECGADQVIELCAKAIGSTAFHISISRGRDTHHLVQVTGVWLGVPVEAWATYDDDPLPLGAVALVPLPFGAGGAR